MSIWEEMQAPSEHVDASQGQAPGVGQQIAALQELMSLKLMGFRQTFSAVFGTH